MSRPTQEPKSRSPEGTRQRILDAAIEVFAEKGYHDTAVDDIVRASDTSKGAVYFHFPNKQGIFLVLIDELTKMLAQRVEQAIAREQDPIAKVETALRTVIKSFSHHRKLSRILLIEAMGGALGANKKLFDIHARFAEIIHCHLDAAVAAGAIAPMDTEVAAYSWFGAINENITRWLYTGKPQRLADSLPELRLLLLRSIGVPAERYVRANDNPEAAGDEL